MNEADTMIRLALTGRTTDEAIERIELAFQSIAVSYDEMLDILRSFLNVLGSSDDGGLVQLAAAVIRYNIRAALRRLLLSRAKTMIRQGCAIVAKARSLYLNRHAITRGVRWSVAATGE